MLTKLLNQANDLLNSKHEELDAQGYYRIVKEKLTLIKSLDEEIINVWEVDHITHKIQKSKEVNLRVQLMIQYIKELTSPKVNIKGNSILT